MSSQISTVYPKCLVVSAIMRNFAADMNILIINGSPRKKGLVSQMLAMPVSKS